MRPVTAPDLAPIEDLERDIHDLCIGIMSVSIDLPIEAGQAGKSSLPIESVKRLCCACPR